MSHMRANNEWMVQDNELTTNIESQKSTNKQKPSKPEKTLKYVYWRLSDQLA